MIAGSDEQLVRNCGNCACLYSVTTGEGQAAQTHHMCRLNPPIVIQQRTQGQVMSTGRGDHQTTVAALLTYPPTVPELVCFGGWRPRGLPAGEDFSTSATLARIHIDELQAAAQGRSRPQT